MDFKECAFCKGNYFIDGNCEHENYSPDLKKNFEKCPFNQIEDYEQKIKMVKSVLGKFGIGYKEK